MTGGLLLVDKPPGITSHDVVSRLRDATGIARVGHAGTLDPFATGLLVVLLGRATRLSQFFVGMDKAYWLRLRLGEASDTLDVTGTVVQRRPVCVTASQLVSAADSFLGEITQLPPMFSAVRVGGQKLYRIARRGITVDRPARRVSVFELRLGQVDLPDVEMFLRCSSGTYVRSLAHDLGQALGCGALVTELRRTRVGPFGVEVSLPLGDLVQSPSLLLKAQIPLERLLPDIPRRIVSGEDAERICSGRDLAWDGETHDWVRLCDAEGRLLAMGRVGRGGIHPAIVLLQGARTSFS